MIFVGKAPYRVSLLGGGSDLDWFVKEKGFGICFGFALKEYSYSVLNILPKNARNGMIDYSTREIYDDINHLLNNKYLSYVGYYVEILPKNGKKYNKNFSV